MNNEDMSKFNVHNTRNTKILVVLIATILVIFSLVIVCVVMMYPSDKGIYVESEKELVDAVNNAVGPIVITFRGDIQLTKTFVILANKTVTLTSDNYDNSFFRLNGPDGDNTITINEDGMLTIDGIIVTHDPESTGRGIEVNFGGTLVLSDGAISDNSVTTYGFGGGVLNDGVFSMSGGEIYGNSISGNGGGVGNRGVFVMSGGTIFDNKVNTVEVSPFTGGGGGVFTNDDFTMSGGIIDNNHAAVHGGGVYVDSGLFSMSYDAVITNNRARTLGGGVYSSDEGIFNMFGGVISNNIASWGGGVNSKNVFEMSGNSEIVNNTATGYGGGVYIGGDNRNGNFKMSDYSIIDGNTGSSSGGGVYIYIFSVFEMSGDSRIVSNTAGSGGGVYNRNGNFNWSDGEIANNKNTADGNDIYNVTA